MRPIACRIMHSIVMACVAGAALGQAGASDPALPLPTGAERPPVEFSHFPDRLHAVVWRNWQLVSPECLAETLGTTGEAVRAMAASMGLPPAGDIPPDWRRRGFITIVRRNWHLLPYEQILQLIDMTPEELAVALREDDFLFVKLGSFKPRCPPVLWEEPSAATRQRVGEIRQLVEEHFGGSLGPPRERPFAFIADLRRSLPRPSGGDLDHARAAEPRIIYTYFGSFGDLLAEPQLDPYPDGLLERLSENGINGVWLHVVLRQLAPGGDDFPEFGAGHEKRLETLRDLVQRCRRHGISVYLYINEPRSMPRSFFAARADMAGTVEGEWQALCTSHRAVRGWLESALAHVFTEVPDLGGVITITASENLTSCGSHGRRDGCPRCRGRRDEEIIAEVNHAIAAGVRRGNPRARVICWDWGWAGHGDASAVIPLLPKDVTLMSVSEWGKPIERGGVRTEVGEYAMSVVGPGPRAERHWKVAREAGLATAAKVQFNTTWELSAVPFLPVMDLVAEHCRELAKRRIDATMLSWSLGGYPSPNLRIAREFARCPDATEAEVLDTVARELYGSDGAPHARAAWSAMSRAFREYPFHIAVAYKGPQQLGPANLLFARPTGYAATMLGFPYDDLEGWRGPYPPEVFAGQFEKVAAGWAEGLAALHAAAAVVPADRRPLAESQLRVAAAAHAHLASVANQARFVMARQSLSGGEPSERAAARDALRRIVADEIRLAKVLHGIVRDDSRIGFEASNHYYTVPLDLVEKVINCADVLARLEPAR